MIGDGLSDDGEADARLGRLCARLAERAGPLTTDPQLSAASGHVLDLVRSGRNAAAELDHLEDLLLRAGYIGGLGSSRTDGGPVFAMLPGAHAGGRPVLEALVCPADRCPRVELPQGTGEDPPECAVWGRALRRDRIT
ncbi:hypothetical protein GCM10010129_72740 [Streptomyces fumigatiscleroticus]|nr:hypothetical protein GCM10010129_72740 [Streptomyces fumigatiscleroticus]